MRLVILRQPARIRIIRGRWTPKAATDSFDVADGRLWAAFIFHQPTDSLHYLNFGINTVWTLFCFQHMNPESAKIETPSLAGV
jgi:hypothetical protein